MTEIKPALSAQEWPPILAELAARPLNEAGERNMNTSPYYDSIGSDATGCTWAIAVNNAALPDSDPRKITREWVAALQIAQAEARKAVGADCTNGPCDDCRAACERFCAKLQGMADALESYLPPDKP